RDGGPEGRPCLPAAPSKGMAVAALFDLTNESAVPLERSCAMEHPLRHCIAAPSVHVWAPGREARHARKRAERDRDQQHAQNRNRPPPPALFSFAGEKWKKEQPDDHHDRTNENCGSFERRGEQRK